MRVIKKFLFLIKAKKETRVNDGMYPPLIHEYTLNDRSQSDGKASGCSKKLVNGGLCILKLKIPPC